MNESLNDAAYRSEMRLLLEELCCDLCRFEHVTGEGLAPESIQIDREFWLGRPDAFADIRVVPGARPPYLVEVKYGYSRATLLAHLRLKYGQPAPGLAGISQIILLVDTESFPDLPALKSELAGFLPQGLEVEIWNDAKFLGLVHQRFQVDIRGISLENLIDIRHIIDRAKGAFAFSPTRQQEYEHDPLNAQLLWHFGFWRLQKLRFAGRASPGDILPTGFYRGVAVLLADLCSFSGYVRDTPDPAIVRESLTAFYSKSRYQIINNGGMLYQFVGDEVVAFFGLPDRPASFARDALETARALVSIGESVSKHWQRRIDRVQPSGGIHVGVAMGDLQVVSLRPFSRTHIGAIGDCINMAARLMATAGPREVIVSNSFYQSLDEEKRAGFEMVEPVDARNVGRIKAWKLHVL